MRYVCAVRSVTIHLLDGVRGERNTKRNSKHKCDALLVLYSRIHTAVILSLQQCHMISFIATPCPASLHVSCRASSHHARLAGSLKSTRVASTRVAERLHLLKGCSESIFVDPALSLVQRDPCNKLALGKTEQS